MYSLPSSTNAEPQPNPTSTQYPLRPAAKGGVFRFNIKRSLRHHTVTAITAGLITLGLGLAIVARHKASFKSTALIYVSPTFPKTLVEDSEQQRPYESFVQEHVHAIPRYDILAEAIRRLPPGTWLFPGESEHSGVERLQQSLDISRVGTTYQVAITLEAPRPEHLAEIVNTVTSVYLEKAKNEEFYGRDDRIANLKQERAKIEAQRDDLLAQQAQISKELGVAAINGQGGNNYDAENSKMQADLIAAHEQRVTAEAQLEALKSGDPSSPNSALNAAANEVIASDPGLMATKANLYQKRAVYTDQLAGLTPNNPVRKQTEDQIAQIDKALADMEGSLRTKAARRLEDKYRAQLNSAQIVENKLNADLQHGTAEANIAAPRIQKAEVIGADLMRLQGEYTAIENRISELEIESSSPGSVHLFSPAMTPLGPEKSKVLALLVLIFPLAGFIGIGSAIAIDLFDPHIYTAADIEAVLGFAPVGMLFDDREVTQMVFDECALRMAAGIDHAARAAGARTFVITAVNSGAGTTSIIESLGSMLAKLGRRTLVIDPSGSNEPTAFVTFGADLQRRAVDINENLNGAKGANSSNTEIQPLKLGRSAAPVKVGPVGGFVFDSFQNMSSDYDIVLIDAAPILLSAETEYLARMADVTVLVSEAGKTKKEWLTRAARLLERLGIAGAAAVINKVNPSRVDEAQQQDLREFEVRNDRMNMQDWWRPGKKAPQAVVTPIPTEQSYGQANEEDVMYARDL